MPDLKISILIVEDEESVEPPLPWFSLHWGIGSGLLRMGSAALIEMRQEAPVTFCFPRPQHAGHVRL